MNQNELRQLQNEPTCQHNGKSKSGCVRATPGETQGGCFFDGARNALLPVADAAHIVHGPIGCAGSSWDGRGSRSSGPTLYRIGMTTDLGEMDVIMGRGEKRLFHAIRRAVEQFRPAAVFVYVTCVPALHGDDVEAVTRDATRRWGIPVIPVDCAGFYGGKNLGNRYAGEVLLKHVIGTREPAALPAKARAALRRVHDVDLIGEWNVGGEFWNVAPLFDELGLRILCTLSGDARFAEIQTMHRARASMVVCSKALLNVARALAERYGIPFFEGSFYGIENTSQAIRRFAALLADPDLGQRAERLIAREEANAWAWTASSRKRLKGKRALIFSGGHKSWSLVGAMQELGLKVVAAGTEKSTEEDKARIRALMGPKARLIADNDQTALLKTFLDYGADILVAGDRYIYPTLKARIPFLDVDHVRDIGYAGYAGAVELAQQLAASVNNPIWDAVRQPAPWHATTEAPATADAAR